MKTIGKTRNVIYWVIGLLLTSLSVAFSTKSNFGLSTATPYILHVWLRDRFPWFTQGTAEYVWQTLMLIALCIVIKRFKWKYLLSFATAVVCGYVLDGWFLLLGGNGPYESIGMRIAAYVICLILAGIGVPFLYRTTMPIQMYELSVTEFCDRYKKDKPKIKLFFDIIMLAIAISLSLLLTKKLTGIGPGTIITAFLVAPLIKIFGTILDKVTGMTPAPEDAPAESDAAEDAGETEE